MRIHNLPFAYVMCATLAASCFVDARPAAAIELLVTDKTASFEHNPTTGEGSAVIRVGGNPGLSELQDPTVCPVSATLQVSSYPSHLNLVVGGPPAELPCDRWTPIPGGYDYSDPTASAGGVRVVRYTTDGLYVQLEGSAFEPVVGPVGYVQVWLTVGSERYLVRFHDFLRNDDRRVTTKRPSRDAADGEAAFWDTLWDVEDRSDEALDFLEDAVSRDARDGRSQFLLAMMRLYRFGEKVSSAESINDDSERDVVGATIAFERAVKLLWDGVKGDTRVPGFAAAATYARGIAQRDPAWLERGLAELDAAAAINHLFNSFDVLGVAGFISGKDPQYQDVLALLDEFDSLLALCGGQDEICFNEGMAPHNIEGTFLLFGDIYAKGGRLEDARQWYSSAVGIGTASGWKPEFLATAQSRLATVEQRVALSQDDDPSNDPPLMGAGNGHGGACAYCHNN